MNMSKFKVTSQGYATRRLIEFKSRTLIVARRKAKVQNDD